jgi:TRAP-type C4-dicarboxylate transport system permease small subunit
MPTQAERNGQGADHAPAPWTERLVTPVVRAFGALSTILLLLAFALTIYAIVARYGFNAPLTWIDELIGFLLVALIMFGVAEAYRKGDHIAVDLITARLEQRGWRLARELWSDACVLAFAVVLGISAWDSISFARSFGSFFPGAIQIETWIPQIPLLIAAILLGAFALARLAGRLLGGARS